MTTQLQLIRIIISIKLLRRLVILADLLIWIFVIVTDFFGIKIFLTVTHLSMRTAHYYTRRTPHSFSPKSSPLLIYPSLSRETPSTLFRLAIGRTTQEFHFRCMTNSKIPRNKFKFPWKKNAHNKTESRWFSYKKTINLVNTTPYRISEYRILAQLWSCHVRKYRRKSLITYLLTPWSTVLLKKLTDIYLVKNFPAFYGTRRFIALFTSARYLSYPEPARSIPYHHIVLPEDQS